MNIKVATIQSDYETAAGKHGMLSANFPSAGFYSRVMYQVFKAAFRCKLGIYTKSDLIKSCYGVLKAVESVKGQVSIQGLDNVAAVNGPCVIAGNHMSTLETFILPYLIQPICPVTFVVKEQLIQYPVFKHIMLSCDPIAVGRQDPRKDLMTMMKEGQKRLQEGTSVVVFPQPTRSHTFQKSGFNSIATKLAARAKVPLVPMAVKTDFWQNGKVLKDYGPVNPKSDVKFAFGEAMKIEAKGSEEQEKLVEFVTANLSEWGVAIED